MRYFGNGFDQIERKHKHLRDLFGVAEADFPKKSEIVYARVDDEAYSSSCHIVWLRDGQFYEWQGGHCSCNGYEVCAVDFADWKPLRTSAEALLMRPELDPDLRDNIACFVPDP